MRDKAENAALAAALRALADQIDAGTIVVVRSTMRRLIDRASIRWAGISVVWHCHPATPETKAPATRSRRKKSAE